MKGPLACLCAAMLCLGCQAPPGAIDPFIGRQTVPPPGTGTPGTQPPGDAYYSGPKAAAAETSPSGTPYTPPRNSFGFQDNSVATKPETNRGGPATGGASSLTTPASRDTTPPATRPNAGGAPARPANPSERPPTTTSASRNTSGAGFQVNNNPTRGLPATTASTRGATSGTRQAPAPARDIMNLPDAPAARTPSSRDSGGFRPPGSVTRANFEEEATDSSPASTSRTPRRETIGAPGSYGRDRNYRWLKGKLEYSRIDDRWKLRYIPIDGDTDDYGGSVVLLGSRLLSEYKPGEYVTVHGTLGDTDARAGGFAPTFHVDRVERQGAE